MNSGPGHTVLVWMHFTYWVVFILNQSDTESKVIALFVCLDLDQETHNSLESWPYCILSWISKNKVSSLCIHDQEKWNLPEMMMNVKWNFITWYSGCLTHNYWHLYNVDHMFSESSVECFLSNQQLTTEIEHLRPDRDQSRKEGCC